MPETPETHSPRTLLAYFSRPGENLHYETRADLEVGHTETVAAMIAEAANVDVYRIEPSEDYPHSYRETMLRALKEQRLGTLPALARPLPDISGYSAIVLGTPVWNLRLPMVIRTFLAGIDLTGRTVYPFVTYGLSPIFQVLDDLETLCPDGALESDLLAVRGEEASASRAQVDTWVRRHGL